MEEILEGVVVEEMVAVAWEWLDKRLLAGFGLDLGWPQAVHASVGRSPFDFFGIFL